jgi:hypothetical protein
MTYTQVTTAAIAFGALLAGPAMASDTSTTVTRDQVRAEWAEAVSTGNIVTGESGERLNKMFPGHYPARQSTPGIAREQVQADMAEAVRTGNVAPNESGARLNELHPHRYPARPTAPSKTREQVQSERFQMGNVYNHIEP